MDVYRGWRRPGPTVTGNAALKDSESLDFLCGHWRIFQYQRGHRYSVDDVLCAWYATTCAPSVRRHLDLGSGIGSVALCVAWRLPGCHTTTIEAQEISLKLATKSVTYNDVKDRFTLLHGDLRDEAVIALALDGGAFDLVTGSPPYWPIGAAQAAHHAQAVPARLEVRGDIADYALAAAKTLAPGGVFVCVFQGSQHARALAALDAAQLTVVRTQPVVFKQGTPVSQAGVVLYCAYRTQDVPTSMRGAPWEEPAVVVRDAQGHTPAAYAAIRMSFGFPPGNMPPDS